MATGSFGYGFGFGVFVASIGQPGFYKDMRLDRKSRHSRTDGLLTWHRSNEFIYGKVSSLLPNPMKPTLVATKLVADHGFLSLAF